MESTLAKMVNKDNLISAILRNPKEAYENLYNNDPKFRDFVEENKGKTIEQIALEHDIDLDKLLK